MIGSELVSARLKSLEKEAESALSALASPNCSIRSPGCARCAAAVAASVASTRFSESFLSPGILNVTSAERPSFESWPRLPAASGDSTSVTCGARCRRAVTSSTAAVNVRSPMRTPPLPWTSTCSEASSG